MKVVGGEFRSHSGLLLPYKFVCDDMPPEEWAAIAAACVAVPTFPVFGRVIGVPRGGLAFAAALEKHVTAGHKDVMIADDVLTTGNSFHAARDADRGATGTPESAYWGVVYIARGVCPWWIYPFLMQGRWLGNAK